MFSFIKAQYEAGNFTASDVDAFVDVFISAEQATEIIEGSK